MANATAVPVAVRRQIDAVASRDFVCAPVAPPVVLPPPPAAEDDQGGEDNGERHGHKKPKRDKKDKHGHDGGDD
jgi:hypothetical protein